jgi:sulfur relay (sulfurtransferase) complex TusBCD TusD component (DsrE family)
MANSIGIILTKTPHGSEDAENALVIGKEALASGKKLGIFLLGDGVWVGKAGKDDRIQTMLLEIIEKGAKVTVSEPHLKAYGLTGDKIVQDIAIIKKPYAEMVEMVMEEWDKVIIF